MSWPRQISIHRSSRGTSRNSAPAAIGREKSGPAVYRRQHDIIKHYQMSIHGRGLSESGLMVSATCTNCHTAHSMLPAKDPKSSVNRENIIDACAQCHLGIAEKFSSSIHSPTVNKSGKKLPVCNDCHTSHSITRHDTADFRGMILDECGTCHEHQTETYFDTYHGKASMLSGGEKTAKCSDCHGSHDILPAYYSKSKLNRRNVVQTCKKCHPGSNRKFTGYLTHATHHDREKYPFLFYTFWAMTSSAAWHIRLLWYTHSILDTALLQGTVQEAP